MANINDAKNVFLRPQVHFPMLNNTPSSSGFVESPSEKFSAQFTDYAELPCKGYNLIFKAKRFGKWHILKGLKPEYRSQLLYQELLRKEFELGVMLTHPNIVSVMSFEKDEKLGDCIVMEYVDGVRLADFLETKPARKQIAKVLDELLSAMSYYHSMQVIHRDLKPSNILITRNGSNVKIIDFGLSDADSYVALKQPAGSLRYAAPEQLQQGMPVDCRTDIYALGKILEYDFPRHYHWLAKKCAKQDPDQRPDNAADVQALLRRHRQLRKIGWIVLVLTLILLGTLFVVLSQLNKPLDSQDKSDDPIRSIEQSEQIQDKTSLPEKDVSRAVDSSSNNLEAKLKNQLDQEMYKRFHPLMQDIKNNKYEWRDESELVRNNILQTIRIEVLNPVLDQVSPSSTEYSTCIAYYTHLYNSYWDSVKTLNKRLPSYSEQSMTLIQQLSEKEISVEEYQRKVQALGPDPMKNWKYNQETQLWERN